MEQAYVRGTDVSPAHPRYVGRGDDTCGGEVVYTIPEIRALLRSQPEDTTRWLTTSQCLSPAKLRSTDSVNPRSVVSRVRPRYSPLL
jgi:hypothetical protein